MCLGNGYKKKLRVRSSTLALFGNIHLDSFELWMQICVLILAWSFLDINLCNSLSINCFLDPLRRSRNTGMDWCNGDFWWWMFGKTKRRWIPRLPNKLAEQLNGPCLLLFSFWARFCVSGIVIFELDYFLWRLCGWVEQQIRKETCDHITECKAKWIVLAIGGESSEYTCAGGI